MSENYLIGRQPILDRNEHLYGYELLFRSTDDNRAIIQDSGRATANVIINTLTSFGTFELLCKRKGFINVDLEMLMDEALELLPADQIVIELLETIEPTAEVIERCKALSHAGFMLVLDDHQYSPHYDELYALVDVVKIDLLYTPQESLPELVNLLRPYPCKLLAEKVESSDLFETCQALGFEYFQGYYFARPDIIKKKKVDENATTFLKLMRLLSEEAGIELIEKAFRESPTLTYKLLMLVNSVSIGLRHKIQSVRHAITLTGLRQIKRWIQLAIFASDGGGTVEHPLLDLAASRAGLMEQLAQVHPQLKVHAKAPEQAYMTGILSMMGSIYDIAIKDITVTLNLNDDIAAALVARAGHYGRLLQILEYIENLDLSSAEAELTAIGIDPGSISDLQLRAFAWSNPPSTMET